MSGEQDRIRGQVQEDYARIATKATEARDRGDSPCSPASGCCGTGATEHTVDEVAAALGYAGDELDGIPAGANLGLGCGNPHALASLSEGEVVVDLGSGAGFDCFVAAKRVGPRGRAIGVDMTPEMLSKARENARDGGYENVEFRLGEIEHLPVADRSADVVMSNCVINLSPDKQSVLSEAFRILGPGGRLAVSDVVRTAELPAEMRDDLKLVSGCISGAASIEELEGMLTKAGFTDVAIEPWDESRAFIRDWAPGRSVEDYVVSATIKARRPADG